MSDHNFVFSNQDGVLVGHNYVLSGEKNYLQPWASTDLARFKTSGLGASAPVWFFLYPTNAAIPTNALPPLCFALNSNPKRNSF